MRVAAASSRVLLPALSTIQDLPGMEEGIREQGKEMNSTGRREQNIVGEEGGHETPTSQREHAIVTEEGGHITPHGEDMVREEGAEMKPREHSIARAQGERKPSNEESMASCKEKKDKLNQRGEKGIMRKMEGQQFVGALVTRCEASVTK